MTNKTPNSRETTTTELEKAWEILHEVAEQNFRIRLNRINPKKLFEIINLMMYNLATYPQDVVKKYYSYAKKDYEAAFLLCHKIPPVAVFHVQQAVEKLTKAYALHMGLIKEEELFRKWRKNKGRTVGHITPRAFILLLKKKGGIQLANFTYILSKKLQLDAEEKIRKFEKLLKKKERLAKLSRNEIRRLIKKDEKIRAAIEEIDPRKVRNRIHLVRVGFISRARPKIASSWVDEVNEKMRMVEAKASLILSELTVFSQLYFLSVITYPHFSYSRYPGRGMAPDDYKKGLGIVDSLDDILKFIGTTLERLEKLKRG
jgi:hypothetical protein